MTDDHALATLAGGCFWCLEAPFEELGGVHAVTSGYAGGHVAEPTYEDVCSGETGHAEVVQIEYDPDRISYADLLAVFFALHDPTTKDRQGPDVGSQYRSAIFTHDDAQRETAEAVIDELADEYDDPIVTEIEPLETFYPAEGYHQNYYANNPQRAYCQVQIRPKLQKVREQFAEQVADD
ncbi:peptide-methionine (S)-S-oxide reductase MsrA [Haloplanus aerogenes]|uniref:Peptide methionine sulfoxide reductase MsrA n=1 Tax=Haloplanus aerogenes TaxID=660522 RepID=A0A3G8QRV9_9EURY|nr:peptide-methionine (S)-S-oxide reductase MsrA [Haloplanus aerogenes]AZH24418.1 peptide-methionine (S)-S-oxide reductase [Haloplanus aerogenes]RMB23940.1 peptide-methionine (S)-S-oxide reductase [Haloplanus aerogenes]